YFFFSSRRRHTRLQGDWSSDVCSSDLLRWLAADACLLESDSLRIFLRDHSRDRDCPAIDRRLHSPPIWRGRASRPDKICNSQPRSEERRVGKECRSRREAEV